MAMLPAAFARDYIFRWEDGQQTDPAKTHSMVPNDPGNWSTGQINNGNLIGSNHGVTPIALANYRGVPVAAITQAVMHALTIDEAVQIALRNYYFGCRLDLLTWSAPVAIMMDGGWGMGPGRMIMLVQDMLDLKQDGIISPGGATATAFNALLAREGEAWIAGALWAMRGEFYERIIAAKPYLAANERGWDNRNIYFSPGDPAGWWARFHGVGVAA